MAGSGPVHTEYAPSVSNGSHGKQTPSPPYTSHENVLPYITHNDRVYNQLQKTVEMIEVQQAGVELLMHV